MKFSHKDKKRMEKDYLNDNKITLTILSVETIV